MPDPWRSRITGHGEADPAALTRNPRNWRTHPRPQLDALAGVLTEVGWVQDVILNRTTGHVVDGHARIDLALSRKEPSVPVVYVDLTPEEEGKVLATLDPIGAMAGADKDALGRLLDGVRTDDAALRATLRDLAEEHGLEYGGDGLPGGQEAPEPELDRAEELRAKWGTAPGQLWVIGRHRLLCGDATKREDVERLLAGEKGSVVWTDPPYGVQYVGKTKDALTLEGDDASGLLDLLVAAFRNTTDACGPGAPWYIAHPPGALCLTFGDAIRRVGWRFHQTLIWVKDSMVLGHSDYHFKHEPIYYGFMPGAGRPGRGDHEGTRWNGDHAQVSVFEIPRPKRSEEHPTVKPTELVAQCLRNSSRPGEVVLDPFAGSGTTLVAAEQGGRTGYGLDIDPKYVAVTLERLSRMGLEPRLES